MSEILSQMFTLPVQIALVVVILIIILLYLISIVWVARDVSTRDTPTFLWVIISIIPVAGLVAYCLLRPPLTKLDRDEQDMELDLLQRQLDEYDNCPNCDYPTKEDYIICPHCGRQLRNVCTRCGKALEPDWDACPYCTTPVRRGAKPAAKGAAAKQDPFTPSE